MRLHWLKTAGLVVGLGLALTAGGWAQVNPPVAPNVPPPGTQPPSPYGGNAEVFLGGGMQFANATTANGVAIATTNVGALQLGLRYHITDYNAIELRTTFARPLQTYGNTLRVESWANEISFAYVWTYPAEGAIRPFFLGGVGAIRYNPTGNNNTPGASSQTKATIVYGGGLDFRLAQHWSIRAEYRGLVYRVPDFGLISISKWNHMPEPDLGLVWHF